ncbi:M20 family peptidase [Peribacillus simplex]|uniref:M20 family metallopeptidase n=1 Tax=Peribacillus simplex TaxID=1478 RepID=UPI000F62F72B|nr:M20 family metallopeptidase [Peribacillus simplex]RRN67731.1 M20 family peptidase [Peribacillus simplex]
MYRSVLGGIILSKLLIKNDVSSYLEVHKQDMLDDLIEFVKKESPSYNKELVDECGTYLSQLFQKRLDVGYELIEEKKVGNHLKFTIGEGKPQILIIGHFDTVWKEGRLSLRKEGNKLYGPGILDMKGGIIQSLWAIKAIQELNLPLNKKIVFLCNSDEEIGSGASKKYIEEEAQKSDAVLVAEPAVAGSGALKTARKGTGSFVIKIWGRAAHAGNHHEEGINAIEELARQVIVLQELTNYEKGTTVNVGTFTGGSGRNVVPEYAEAHVDLRVSTEEEARRVTDIILNLKPILKGINLEVTGGLNRPPMVKSEQTRELFECAQSIASELGMKLEEASVGGGSDGNFTAAIGVPTLDGLGSCGKGIHAEYEHIQIDTLPERASLFANLLLRL